MSDPSQTRIVIVGAGQAGARAAEALRTAGHRGSITLLGEEEHLPYERPQLSKDMLVDVDAPPRFIRAKRSRLNRFVVPCAEGRTLTM